MVPSGVLTGGKFATIDVYVHNAVSVPFHSLAHNLPRTRAYSIACIYAVSVLFHEPRKRFIPNACIFYCVLILQVYLEGSGLYARGGNVSRC
jgi:hypothetical protein